MIKELSQNTIRKPDAALRVVWGDVSANDVIIDTGSYVNRNRIAIQEQLVETVGIVKKWAYCVTTLESDSVAVVGDCCAAPDPYMYSGNHLVGFWGSGKNISDNNGYISNVNLYIKFYNLVISNVEIIGHNEEYPVDFIVGMYNGDPIPENVVGWHNITGNTKHEITLSFEPIRNVNVIRLNISKWSHKNTFIKIVRFRAYMNECLNSDNINMIGVLEETDGAVGTLPIGNISANELSINLQNLDKNFSYRNDAALYSNSTRTGLKIEPLMGFIDLDTNEKHLISKGTFWTRDWSVSETEATTTAIDRLGLMQDLQYDYNDKTWENKTLYEILYDLLYLFREKEMPNFEFSEIPDSLHSITIRSVSFNKQSWFELLKSICQAGLVFAFMDTPTNTEKEKAEDRGNYNCNDILRIIDLKDYAQSYKYIPVDYIIDNNDIINKTMTYKRAEVVNAVFVTYDDGILKSVILEENKESQLEFGKIAIEWNVSNDLIQSYEQAVLIAKKIISVYSNNSRAAEITCFGDITRKIGDVIEIPEYKEKSGVYIISKINNEYDGGFRQTIFCRRLGDAGRVITLRFILDGKLIEAPESRIKINSGITEYFDGGEFEMVREKENETFNIKITARSIPFANGGFNV